MNVAGFDRVEKLKKKTKWNTEKYLWFVFVFLLHPEETTTKIRADLQKQMN